MMVLILLACVSFVAAEAITTQRVVQKIPDTLTTQQVGGTDFTSNRQVSTSQGVQRVPTGGGNIKVTINHKREEGGNGGLKMNTNNNGQNNNGWNNGINNDNNSNSNGWNNGNNSWNNGNNNNYNPNNNDKSGGGSNSNPWSSGTIDNGNNNNYNSSGGGDNSGEGEGNCIALHDRCNAVAAVNPFSKEQCCQNLHCELSIFGGVLTPIFTCVNIEEELGIE